MLGQTLHRNPRSRYEYSYAHPFGDERGDREGRGARGALLGRVKRTDRFEGGANFEAINGLDACSNCSSRPSIQCYCRYTTYTSAQRKNHRAMAVPEITSTEENTTQESKYVTGERRSALQFRVRESTSIELQGEQYKHKRTHKKHKSTSNK